MSLQILMNSGASAQGGPGVGLMTAAGNPWSVPDALAQTLVNRGLATAYNWPVDVVPALASSEIAQVRGLVSGAWKIPVLSTGTSYAAGLANSQAINALLAAGGRVAIPPGLGPVFCSQTLLVPSYSELVVGAGSWIKRPAQGIVFHQVRNKSCHNAAYVNGLTISGGTITVPEAGHSRAVGDIVYCENWLTATTLNGPQTITAVNPGVSWTIAASGSNPTNTNIQLVYLSTYNPLAAANFVRASNVVTVTETGHTRAVGDPLYIAGLATDTSFNGCYVVSSTVPGVSWTYASTGSNGSPTGTAQLLGDRTITYDLYLDGNMSAAAVNLTGNHWGGNLSQWGNVGNLTGYLREARNSYYGRAANHYNCYGVEIPLARGRDQVAVLLQFDALCDRVHVGTADTQNTTDDTVAWGVTGATGIYADTAHPPVVMFSQGSMGTLTGDQIIGTSPTGMLKMYCMTGYTIGDVIVGKVLPSAASSACVTMGDPNTGVAGGAFSSITLGEVGGAVQCANSANWGTMGPVRIGKLIDTQTNTAANNTGEALYITGPMTLVTVDLLIAQVARTQSAAAKFTPTAANSRVRFGRIDSTAGVGGYVLLARGGTPVDTLTVDGWWHSGAGNTAGTLVYSDVAGDFTNVYINNFRGGGFGGLVKLNSAGLTRNVYLSNVVLGIGAGVGIGVGSDNSGTFNIWLSNVDGRTGNISNNLIQFGAASQTIRALGSNVFTQSGKFALGGASQTLSINCPSAQLAADLAGLVPQAGDVIYNTNTALGTLGQAGPVIRRGGDSKWVLMANTLLTS